MTIENLKLLKALKLFETELRDSGKIGTADYFLNHIDTIGTENNIARFQNCLEEICSAGAMSQYANFSIKEDELFTKCQKEARTLLQSNSDTP